MQTRADPERQPESQHSVELGALEARPLGLALDSIPALLHTAEPDGSLDYFNRRWLDYLGASPDDIKGWGWISKIHPEDSKVLVKKWRNSLETGQPLEIEARIQRNDGVYRWMLHRKIPLRDEHGKIIKWYGSSIDIDDRKWSEFYLAEGQRLGHAGSWSFKPDGTCDYWSRELYEILGFDPDGGIPRISDYLTRVHPQDRKVVEATIQRMIAAGEGCDLKKRIIRPDGVQRVIRCVGMAVQEKGVVTRFVGTLMDITEQEELAQELQRREAYLAEAQRLSHTGSFGWNVVTGELTWSEENYRILGYDKSIKPTFELVRDRIHSDDLEIWEEAFARASEGNQVDFEHRLLMPDDSVKHLQVVAYGVQRDGKFVELVGTARDITEQKAAERAVRLSEGYLSEAQRLSHTGSFGWRVSNSEILWSEETFQIFQYDMTMKPTVELILQRVHPDDAALVKTTIERASQDGKDFDFEHRLLMPDGSIKHLHVVAHAERDESDSIEFVGAVMDVTNQRQVEESLRKSEAYLTDAQKLSQTGSWAWNPDTGVKYWSEECYRVLGFDPRDGPPQTEELIRRIHPDDQPAFRKSVKRATQTKSDEEVDYRIVHPGGAVRGIHSIGHPVFSSTGDLIEFRGTVIDVTERKRVEEELRASERKYRNLVDTTPAFIHTASPDGALDFLSRGWQEYGGLTLSDLKDWRWAAAIHPKDVEGFVDKWRAALASGEPFEAESRVRRADGEYCWFLQRNVPFRDETGKIVKWYGTGINITERKIAEEAIRRGEAFLAEGQRLSHTGSWGWNASTGKVTWSQEQFRILGLDPQTTNPSRDVFWERVHPDDRIGLRRTFESAIREKRDFEQEFRIVTPDWSIRHLHGVGHAILNEANELVEFIGSAMDITEHKRAEERAQSQREAILLALNAFVEKLDVNRFLADIIAELNKQFHAKSWELWLFDEAINALVLQSSSHPTECLSRAIGSKSARPLEELLGIWPIKDAARAPQIVELSAQDSLLSRRHGESLTRQGIKTLMIVPLVLGKQNLGFLELHFQLQPQFNSDDLELAQALVNHATLALQLNRLNRRAEQLAVTEERNRLAREIHDTLAQAFAGIVLHSEVLGASLGVSKQRCAKALAQIQKLARSGLEEARRSVQALRPKALDGNTLPEALRQAAIRLNEDAKLSCQFRQRGKKIQLSVEIQNELFRIGQEALTNVVKHARAKSVYITLVFQARSVSLSIKDDGVGFTAAKLQNQRHRFGMGTMRERAQRIGGRLRAESRPGRGTTIRVVVPLSANRSKKKVTL